MNSFLQNLDLLDLASRYAVGIIRIGGMMMFLPIFGIEIIPKKIRFLISAGVALVLMGILPPMPDPPTDAVTWVVVGFRELTIGFILGITAKIIFTSVEMGAGFVATQSGFAMARMMDPITGSRSMAPAFLINLTAAALFLATDLHHLFFKALYASYELLPPSAGLPNFGNFGNAAGGLGMRMFDLAVMLAAPGLIIAVSMDVLLGLVGKAMARVPILIVGFPVKLMVGMVCLILVINVSAASIGKIGRTLAGDTMALMHAMAGN